MKQLGNLAVICAQRPALLVQLRGGRGLVQAKTVRRWRPHGTMTHGSKR